MEDRLSAGVDALGCINDLEADETTKVVVLTGPAEPSWGAGVNVGGFCLSSNWVVSIDRSIRRPVQGTIVAVTETVTHPSQKVATGRYWARHGPAAAGEASC